MIHALLLDDFNPAILILVAGIENTIIRVFNSEKHPIFSSIFDWDFLNRLIFEVRHVHQIYKERFFHYGHVILNIIRETYP